jgi:hypothetical protein
LVNAIKLGVVILCAALVFGAANGAEADSDNVQDVTFAQARTCRVIDTLSVENQSSPDEDIERGAIRKAKARAAEKGGDAILIQSTVVTPSTAAGGPSVMTLKGQILVCHSDVAAK